MKILYLNVAVGCKEAGRYRKLVNFINRQRPDILGLSELNGWDTNNFARLSRFKAETGLRFSVFCRSPHGYHLALFSKTRLNKIQVLRRGLWHGAIIATANIDGKTYEVALTHLSPVSEEMRLKDMKRIFARFKVKRKTFLMGDMNSISPQDAVADAALLHKAKKLKIKKFGTDKVEKRVIARMLEKGFLDVSHLSGQKSGVYSVPTRLTRDREHFARLHLDYIFITKDLRTEVKRVGMVRNKEADTLSDHYPIFVQLK